MKYKNSGNKIGRRNFLAASAATVLGYSAIITAPQVLARPLPSDENSKRLAKLQPKSAPGSAEGEKLMRRAYLECDLLVAGGGLSGIAAALSAARAGKKVILVQDRSRLGGNSSSEIRMHPLGVNPGVTGWREGGIIEELKLENAAHNPQLAWEMWDFILYDKCVTEPNLTLMLDSTLYRVETSGRNIEAVWVRSDTTRNIYRIKAKIYVDSTGDSRLAMEAGAEVMSGREGSKAFGESLADFDEIGTRQGSTLMISMRKHDKPMPFTPPPWAKKMTPELMKFRGISGDGLYYGYWWVELGGIYDAIRDNEMLRFELLSIVMGVWDYIKNSGKYSDVENIALETIGMVPGRRDTYRVVGGQILTQQDIEGKWKTFDDAIAVGGWTLDDHPAKGFYASDRHPCRQTWKTNFYNIPYGTTYSKDFDNLMMAGRNISASHLAFTSTRVMNSCAVGGQAAGTAAAMCAKSGCAPKDISASPELVGKLQQNLLKDGHIILGVKNSDPLDLARKAKISASNSSGGTKPENIISGMCYDISGAVENRWKAPISEKPELSLEWEAPQKIGRLILNIDTGSRLLTPTLETGFVKRVIQGPQPESLKDFTVRAKLANGREKTLAEIKGNYQKRVVIDFPAEAIKRVTIKCLSTNGAPEASILEVRAYGNA